MTNNNGVLVNTGKLSYDVAALPVACRHDKLRFGDEESARIMAAHAERATGTRDSPFTVYRCPGYQCWHMTSRGFRVSSLRTMNRTIAGLLFLARESGMDVDELREQCGAGTDTGRGRQRNFRNNVRAFLALGLVEHRISAPARLFVVDAAGLLRIVEVGLRGLIAERGVEVRPGERDIARPAVNPSDNHGRWPTDPDVRASCARYLAEADGRVLREDLRLAVLHMAAQSVPGTIKMVLREFEVRGWARRADAYVEVLDVDALRRVAAGEIPPPEWKGSQP